MLENEAQHRPHTGYKPEVLLIIGIMALTFVHLWVYAATASLYAISMVYILSSVLLLTVTMPMIFLDCKRMIYLHTPETSSTHTAVMLAISLFMIMGFFSKVAFFYSGYVLPVKTLWLCNILDSVSLFVMPVIWCIFRFCEYLAKEKGKVSYGGGQAHDYGQCESVRFEALGQEAVYIPGQHVIRGEEGDKSVDEVDQAFLVHCAVYGGQSPGANVDEWMK